MKLKFVFGLAAMAMLSSVGHVLAYDFKVDGVCYNFKSRADRTVEVTYNHPDSADYVGTVVIPAKVECPLDSVDYSVVAVGNNAFSSRHALTAVDLPAGLQSIGNGAFCDCTALTEIKFPESVDSVGVYAFVGCSTLNKVVAASVKDWCEIGFADAGANPLSVAHELYIGTEPLSELKPIDAAVTAIKPFAFAGASLSAVDLSNTSVERIGASAFLECVRLTKLNIGNAVAEIGENAFGNCVALAEVSFGKATPEVGQNAFAGCGTISKVNTESVASWCAVKFDNALSNPLYWTRNFTLGGAEVGNLVIPDGVTEIGNYAFYNCSALESVAFPASVKTVGKEAFHNCSGLTLVDIADVAMWCGLGFEPMTNPLYYAKNLSVNGMPVAELTIPGSVDKVNDYAFYNCRNIKALVVSDGVKSVGERAFGYCCGLTSVDLGNSVDAVGKFAFYGCENLQSLIFGQSLTAIGSDAFARCSELRLIVAGNDVPPVVSGVLGSKATACMVPSKAAMDAYKQAPVWSDFDNYYVDKLKADFVAGGLSYGIIPDAAGECTVVGVESVGGTVVIPSTVADGGRTYAVTAVSPMAFAGGGIRSVVVPGSVRTLAPMAFARGIDLDVVEFEASDTELSGRESIVSPRIATLKIARPVSSSVFSGSLDVTAVEFSGTTDVATMSMFRQNEMLKHASVLCPYVADGAFKGCYGLGSVSLGADVATIGESAFEGCRRLSAVRISAAVTSVGKSAFAGCTGLTSVDIADLAGWCSIDFADEQANPLYWAKKLYLNGTIISRLEIPESVSRINDYVFADCKFESIVCNHGTVPEGTAAAFSDITYRFTPLYVPAAKIEAYRTAPLWREFAHILALGNGGSDGIGDVALDGDAVKVVDGTIVVASKLPTIVYDMAGRVVYNGTDTIIELPRGGFYVVTNGAVRVKVAL